MALTPIKNARGVKLVLKVGNGAQPEVFTARCTINAARGITFTATTNDSPAIICETPDAIAWVLREKSGLSASVTGAGMTNTPDVQVFFDWLVSPDSKNCQVVLDVPATDGGVIFAAAFHLSEFAVTGDRGGKVESSITLISDGAVTSTPNT